jgi:hypothetical protein
VGDRSIITNSCCLFVPGNDGVTSCLDQRESTEGEARDVSEGEFSVSTPSNGSPERFECIFKGFREV